MQIVSRVFFLAGGELLRYNYLKTNAKNGTGCKPVQKGGGA